LIPPFLFTFVTQLLPPNTPLFQMAELQDSPAAEGPQVPQQGQTIYLTGTPLPDGKTHSYLFNNNPSSYSIAQLTVDPLNPNRATAVPTPGSDEALIKDHRNSIESLFEAKNLPGGNKFVHVDKPAIFERDGDSWKMVAKGDVEYSDKPQVQQVQPAAPVQQATTGPQVLYMNGAVSEGIPLDKQNMSTQKASYSTFEIRVDQNNPNRAQMVPAPGNDEMLLPNYNAVLKPVFGMREPVAGDKYIHVGQPAELERVGDTWRMVSKGELSFGPSPQVQQTPTPAEVKVPYGFGPPQVPAQPAQQANPTPNPKLNYTQFAPTPETGVVENRKTVGQASPQFNIGITADGKFGINPQVSQERLIGDGMSKLKAYFDFEAPNQYPIARVNVDTPGQMEKTEDGWRVASKGSLVVTDTQGNVFRTTPRQEQPQQTQAAAPAATPAPKAPVQTGPTEPKPAASLGLDANPTPAPSATNTVASATLAAVEQKQPGVGELQITWKQKGNEVAPLTEMRAYFDSLKEQGVAVGAMKFAPGADGKLTGSFGVSYDPNAPDLTKLEGTIQGLKKVGGGLDVVEAPEQAVARRRGLGHDGQDKALDLAFPIKEAFGVRQWDSLSAQLSTAPKQALTAPEQAQQAAGIERVGQIAKQQGKTTEQVIQEGKNLLEVDTSGNPVSAFLKNFYDHLNGAPKTRQHLEVDYEKTRQELQARLTAKAGNALPDGSPSETVAKAPAVAAAVVGAAAASAAPGAPSSAEQPAPKVEVPAVPKPEPLFKESELPKDKLALFGLSIAKLKESGQLEKLLAGEKTDLLAMQGGAQRDKPLVPFDGKLMLHREANGSVTLNVELPKQKLVIPNEIGGQPFTPEQRHKLETEGSAGLMRGLRDAAGNPYNGYVGVDKTMNTIVILPENKVTIKDEIAGVKLSPEQSKDLREGHLVHLPNMRRPDGGQSFDGTVQIHAAKAGVEVRPEPYEQHKKKQPELTQAQPVATERSEKPGQKPAAETVQVQRQEVAPKPVEKVEEPTPQRSRGIRR
jgi:hypothetical protein